MSLPLPGSSYDPPSEERQEIVSALLRLSCDLEAREAPGDACLVRLAASEIARLRRVLERDGGPA